MLRERQVLHPALSSFSSARHSAYPADEGGIGERGPHVVELEVVHVVEELCQRYGGIRPHLGTPRSLSHPLLSTDRLSSLHA